MFYLIEHENPFVLLDCTCEAISVLLDCTYANPSVNILLD